MPLSHKMKEYHNGCPLIFYQIICIFNSATYVGKFCDWNKMQSIRNFIQENILFKLTILTRLK